MEKIEPLERLALRLGCWEKVACTSNSSWVGWGFVLLSLSLVWSCL